VKTLTLYPGKPGSPVSPYHRHTTPRHLVTVVKSSVS